MRVCFVVGMFPALSETFILNQITGLMDLGHEVYIYAGARSSETAVHEEVVRCGLLSRTHYYHDKPASCMKRLFKFFMLFPATFWRAPWPVLRSLNILRYGREAWSLNLFYKVRFFLDVKAYDVILCHFGQNGLLGLQMKQMGAITGKLVTVFHAADISAYVRREGKAVYEELFKSGDLFLAISEHTKKILMALGCSEDKLRVHAMGIDIKAFPLTTRKLFAQPPLNILSVARLVEKKGIAYALEAAALLKQAGVAFTYNIIGDGPLRSVLQEQVFRLGLEGCVRFLGARDAQAVRRSLQQADVLLAPSICAENGDEEGLPVVLMEAMASGVPVVTTLTGGVDELVVDRKTGFLVEEKNARGIADRIMALCHDPELLRVVAGCARRAVEAGRDVRRLNEALEGILKELSGERSLA